MAIYKSALDLVGNTPLLEVTHFEKDNNLEATVLVKLEYFNPAGSVKDRIAKAIIEDAEKTGKLKPDSVIIEPTSGNTGIGLASVAAAKGYRAILTLPEKQRLVFNMRFWVCPAALIQAWFWLWRCKLWAKTKSRH